MGLLRKITRSELLNTSRRVVKSDTVVPILLEETAYVQVAGRTCTKCRYYFNQQNAFAIQSICVACKSFLFLFFCICFASEHFLPYCVNRAHSSGGFTTSIFSWSYLQERPLGLQIYCLPGEEGLKAARPAPL